MKLVRSLPGDAPGSLRRAVNEARWEAKRREATILSRSSGAMLQTDTPKIAPRSGDVMARFRERGVVIFRRTCNGENS